MHATIPPTSWPVTEGRLDASVDIEDAIVDGGGAAPAIEATTARVVAATVIGLTDTTVLDASDALFTGRVDCDRSQEGCVQFSYVPLGSRTPRRHRCEPDTAIADRPRDAELLRAAIVPVFTGVTLDHPGYGQVASTCPDEIRRGAHDAGEVGAFHFLQQPQREANLHASLEEYLRFGLEAGLVYVT